MTSAMRQLTLKMMKTMIFQLKRLWWLLMTRRPLDITNIWCFKRMSPLPPTEKAAGIVTRLHIFTINRSRLILKNIIHIRLQDRCSLGASTSNNKRTSCVLLGPTILSLGLTVLGVFTGTSKHTENCQT